MAKRKTRKESSAASSTEQRAISNMKSVRDQVKKRNLDWMIAFNNPTPIEFFRFIQPTHKARAIEKYGKILNEAIRLCKVPNEQSKLKNIKETVNCNSDWDVWLLEKRAMKIRDEVHKTNTEVHRELNAIVGKRAIELDEQEDEDEDAYSSNYASSSLTNESFSQQQESNSSSILTVLEKYSAKETTSPYDLAHSFIVDLSPSSKIKGEFSNEEWAELVKRRPEAVRKSYHHEIEPLISHLFGKKMDLSEARKNWYELRNLVTPRYHNEFSYAENDWEKIKRWVERVTGQFLDAFESSRNPLQNDCHEREWSGDYIIPLIQGALKLDGKFYVPWGEISALATQRRRNDSKDILTEQVERSHQVDFLCNYEQYEIACALVCGGPYSYDLTKLASDEFNLPRIMKDMLDDLELKFLYAGKNGLHLYIVGIQTYMTEVRIYLIERREIYFFHHLKTFNLPLTFSTYQHLKCAFRVAWNVRGLVNLLVQELNTVNIVDDDGFRTPPMTSSVNKKTKETPPKRPKRKKLKN